ncbi:alpha/beta fold hydrolase [Streptomyces sp. NPDC057638]|uniref:alpha/beta fold hydrolase n=1 Tax=Streptomyces sp. NPDC057638 TaxID=3346190 RepID=UPI0036C7AD65
MASMISFSAPTPGGAQTVSLSYERTGAGDPLLLLHGIGHHRQAWDPVIRLLAGERDVIAVDLPGFGISPPLPREVPYGLESVAAVLSGLCEALEIERPHVAGNSLGGLLALELARGKLVRSATALSPGGFWTEGELRYALALLGALRKASLSTPLPMIERLSRSAAGRAVLTGIIYARPARRSPDAVLAETLALREATGFESTLAAGRTVRFTDDVPDVPVTIAWGTRDLLLPRRQGVRAKHIIPGARLIRLPRCGHVPMSDDPALVARVLLDGSGRRR